MTLQEILCAKGRTVYTIHPDASVGDAVQVLVEHHVGSLLVCEPTPEGGERLVGIITERDLLYAHAGQKPAATSSRPVVGQCPVMGCKVSSVMSSDLVTATPSDLVEQIMELMTSRRVRHLPVLDEGKVVGIVSIGDVVKSQHDRLAVENQYMKDYIRG